MFVNKEYVEARFAQFVRKYREVLASLGYGADEIAKNTAMLTERLKKRDFKLYGARPINELHGGKRITRFLIRSAIEFGPAQRARRAALQTQYHEKITEERRRNPCATFFSFEAAYASKLRINFGPMRQMFYI